MSSYQFISYETVIIYTSDEKIHSNRIISFDLDDTLISTKSKNIFAKNSDDWQWNIGCKEKITELYNNGYSIIIFSNQKNILKNAKKLSILKDKIEKIVNTLDFPIQIYISTTDDLYRKPEINMWKLMCKFNKIIPDLEHCEYIGDAAGRANDFSCSDRKFAHNIGIHFKTPEEYFMGCKSEEFEWDIPNFSGIITKEIPFNESEHQEMIILVGYPGSGKSTFAHRYLPNYTYINNDTTKSVNKSIKLAKLAVANKQSIVIDNINSSIKQRAIFIDIANKYHIPVRCIYFDVSERMAKHLNKYRERLGIRAHVPNICYNVYNKNFEYPTKDEGFIEIIIRSFILMPFNNKNEERLFYMYD